MDPIFVKCTLCDGSAEILTPVMVYESGCGFSHPDVNANPCPQGDGTGREEVERAPITLEDLP